MRYDCIIIGAGPAGLTAAAILARCGKRVLILDKNTRAGRKLLLAGGGKGNMTNRRVAYTDYVGALPQFAAYALSRVTPEMVTAQLQSAAIPLEERDHGRIFCTTSTKAALDMLLDAIPRESHTLKTEQTVTSVNRQSGVFTVTCESTAYTAPCLVLATGSPAWPVCGADDSGLRIAKSLGHAIMPPKPVLVPLVMPDSWPLAGLAGVSCEVYISCTVPGAPSFRDSLLFTHKGVSGPAALQISCYWSKGAGVGIDFLPDFSVKRLLDEAKGKATPWSVLSPRLPDRLLAALLPPDAAKRRVAELSRNMRDAINDALHKHVSVPARTEGLGKAEAASGGVAVQDVDPTAMQSRLTPGLFFCGEVLDITGRLGGYNIHWAFASGTVAGEAASVYPG